MWVSLPLPGLRYLGSLSSGAGITTVGQRGTDQNLGTRPPVKCDPLIFQPQVLKKPPLQDI